MSSSDEEQVRALVVAYAELLDAGDLDGVSQLFARGSFRSARGGPPRVGVDAVRKMYDAVVLYDDGTPHTKHVLGNLVVEVDDRAGTATASCTFTVIQRADDAPLQAVLSGRYVDRFERDGGVWHFVERVVHPELFGDLSLHMGGR